MRHLWRAFAKVGLPLSSREPSPPRRALRLVSPRASGEAAQELLAEATREFVQAFDQYAAAWESRFNGRQSRKKYWLASSSYVQLKVARDEYYKRAGTSSDPVHRHVATLIENSGMWVPQANTTAVRLLRNWLRDEPLLETHPADPWFAAIAPRVDIAPIGLAGFHTATLSFELKASLPRPGVLCVDVATDVLSASASLITGSKASSGNTDVLWKRSRVWVTFGQSRLEVGDLVNITVAGAKAISRPATVRIATLVTGIVSASSG